MKILKFRCPKPCQQIQNIKLLKVLGFDYIDSTFQNHAKNCRKSTKTNIGIGFLVLFQLLYSTFLMLLKTVISKRSKRSKGLHMNIIICVFKTFKTLSNLHKQTLISLQKRFVICVNCVNLSVANLQTGV